jgi:galactonate dehydratase
VPWRETVLGRPLPIRNGFVELSDEPGLGFDLDEAELEKHPGVTRRRPGFYV